MHSCQFMCVCAHAGFLYCYMKHAHALTLTHACTMCGQSNESTQQRHVIKQFSIACSVTATATQCVRWDIQTESKLRERARKHLFSLSLSCGENLNDFVEISLLTLKDFVWTSQLLQSMPHIHTQWHAVTLWVYSIHTNTCMYAPNIHTCTHTHAHIHIHSHLSLSLSLSLSPPLLLQFSAADWSYLQFTPWQVTCTTVPIKWN